MELIIPDAHLSFEQKYQLLEKAYQTYNVKAFVQDDPIGVPKEYKKKQDIEIVAFWTAMFSWGQRKTIINKSLQLFELMGNEPYRFITEHSEKDRKRFEKFVHRTFQYTDTLYFLEFFRDFYQKNESLEAAFLNDHGSFENMESSLTQFHNRFFSLEFAPRRTRKHVSTPARNSSCKRLNMFLRWMVRQDPSGVDFGIWENIPISDLMIPLDIHVYKIAKVLNLLERKQTDWKSVVELTDTLKRFDENDPVKYDFALFGIGVLNQKYFKS